MENIKSRKRPFSGKWQGKKKSKTSVNMAEKKAKMAVSVGFWGGLIWHSLWYLAHFLNMSSIGPRMFVKPFVSDGFYLSVAAQWVGIGVATLASIVWALFYVYSLVRLKRGWIGLGYGLVIWAFYFLLLSPILGLSKPVWEMGANTISTLLSIFSLYGLFIGYSLFVEFNNPDHVKNKQK